MISQTCTGLTTLVVNCSSQLSTGRSTHSDREGRCDHLWVRLFHHYHLKRLYMPSRSSHACPPGLQYIHLRPVRTQTQLALVWWLLSVKTYDLFRRKPIMARYARRQDRALRHFYDVTPLGYVKTRTLIPETNGTTMYDDTVKKIRHYVTATQSSYCPPVLLIRKNRLWFHVLQCQHKMSNTERKRSKLAPTQSRTRESL